LKTFLNNLDQKKYRVDFDVVGNSNYAFPLILKKASFRNRKKLEHKLKIRKIEFRRGNAGGGNQLRQPYLKKYIKGLKMKNFKEVDHIHFFGYYIGNYPSLKKSKIIKICKILNSIDFNIK
jgi:CDP-6-deoxy-D-xylo-4-hexulose-3-dehydrase